MISSYDQVFSCALTACPVLSDSSSDSITTVLANSIPSD